MSLWMRIAPPRPDRFVALGFVALSQVEVWHYGVAGGEAAGAALQAAAASCLAWRRRAPLTAAVVAMGAAAVCTALVGEAVSLTLIATTLALFYTLGRLADRRRAVAGLIFGLAIGVPMTQDGSVNTYLAAVLTSFVTPWLVGTIRLRQARAQALEVEREEAARIAAAEERARLARELHDVVSHNIGMIVVQAEAADVLLDRDEQRARQSVHAIEEAGRTALVEMRRLLGLLREEGEAALTPQPTLARVDELAERMRRTGVSVDVRVDGQAVELEPTIDLAAYRVVQEGLTNVLKHAGPCSATVAVRYRPSAVEVEVVDSGRGAHAAAPGTGFGHSGLRERVGLLGGTFEAGPREGGGYAIAARLPRSVPSA